jgi:hypothetical protein
MKYSIEADGEFLRVKVSGRDSDEPPSDVCAVIYKQSRSLGRNRILIELDQKRPLSPTSQLMLVNRLPQIGFTPQDRIAVVHRAPEMQRDNELLNTIAANRGVMVRSFRSVEDAGAWLRQAAA